MNERPDIPEAERWRVYESEKRAWIAQHPEASSEDYEQAMRRIAERCGV